MRPIDFRDLVGIGPVSVPRLIPSAPLRQAFRFRRWNTAEFIYPANLAFALVEKGVNPIFEIRVIPYVSSKGIGGSVSTGVIGPESDENQAESATPSRLKFRSF